MLFSYYFFHFFLFLCYHLDSFGMFPGLLRSQLSSFLLQPLVGELPLENVNRSHYFACCIALPWRHRKTAKNLSLYSQLSTYLWFNGCLFLVAMLCLFIVYSLAIYWLFISDLLENKRNNIMLIHCLMGWGSTFGKTKCERPIFRIFEISDIEKTKD